jgi:serine/threonine protein kinase/Flp pilus assembly protein TadD
MKEEAPVPLTVTATGGATRNFDFSQTSPASTERPHVPDHELLRLIGQGSYGEVWLARSLLGTLRAVKIVRRTAFEDDTPFRREFHGIQKFEPISRTHEGLVGILQVGTNEAEGYFYCVMELADSAEVRDEKSEVGDQKSVAELHLPDLCSLTSGLSGYTPRTLRSDTKHRGALPPGECITIGLALTRALAHLHRHGLVHRDIKPSNIIFIGGTPRLADIGLVTDLDATRTYVGTEGFMAPEGPGTPQADIYSLGKVLYEMATGKDRHEFPDLPTALRAGSSPDARSSRRKEAHSSKSEVLPRGGTKSELDESLLTSAATVQENDSSLPAANRNALLELNEIFTKACASDPRQRYQSADEMAADLERLQHGHSIKRTRAAKRRWALAKNLSLVSAAIVTLFAAGWLLSNRFNVSTIQRSNKATAELNSIAVLPFVNENAAWTPHEYLTDALTLETMNALTNCAGLRVAPRAAVFAFKRTTNDLRQIGGQLGVRTVLAGSMKKFTNQLHIAARLINTTDGSNLWSASYDQDSTNFATIQSEVVRQVARRLNVSVDEDMLQRLEANLMRKLAAYKLYSKAITNWKNTQEGLDRSIGLLNQVISEDPNFANAYAELAYRYLEASGFYLPQVQALSAARINALHALQLDEALPLAHRALALVYWRHELDLAQAEAHFQRAIEIDPNAGDTYGEYAMVLSYFGRFSQAAELLIRGERVAPSDHNLHGGRCWRYYLARDFEKTKEASRHFRTVHPDSVMGPYFLARAHEGLREYDEALSVAQSALQLDRSPVEIAFLGRIHARLGHGQEAEQAVDELRVLSRSNHGGVGTFSAEILLALGEKDRAIEQLQQAVANYPPCVLWLRTNPVWDDLHSDPRFTELLKKAGLEK